MTPNRTLYAKQQPPLRPRATAEIVVITSCSCFIRNTRRRGGGVENDMEKADDSSTWRLTFRRGTTNKFYERKRLRFSKKKMIKKMNFERGKSELSFRDNPHLRHNALLSPTHTAPLSMSFHHGCSLAAKTPPITPAAPFSTTPTATTTSRSFEEYRYAIEAGLISPHHERCYVPAWEQPQQPSAVAGVVSSRARVGKRYHPQSNDGEDADDASQIMMCEHRVAAR